MLGTMKRVALVAVGAFAAPAMASADAWDVNGTPVGGSPGIAVEGAGTISFSVNLGGPVVTTTCDFDVAADVWNVGGVGVGAVSAFVPDWLTCSLSGIPNCWVGSMTTSTPWSISTVGPAVTVGFDITIGYFGSLCPIAGGRRYQGSATGDWSNPGELRFTNASGVTVSGLPALVNGDLYLEEESTGGQLYLR